MRHLEKESCGAQRAPFRSTCASSDLPRRLSERRCQPFRKEKGESNSNKECRRTSAEFRGVASRAFGHQWTERRKSSPSSNSFVSRLVFNDLPRSRLSSLGSILDSGLTMRQECTDESRRGARSNVPTNLCVLAALQAQARHDLVHPPFAQPL